jgi:glycosyltransferase involved in cell wall biosynthesis
MQTESRERKLRVMHVVSGDLWAGAEAQAWTLLTSLSRREDVEPAAVVLNRGELATRLADAGIRTWLLDESAIGTLHLARLLRRAMREFAPDIVHTHRQKENVLGALVAASLGVPSLRTAHGAEEHEVAWHDARRFLARLVDSLVATFMQRAVVAVSDELAARLSAVWPSVRIEVIDNTVDEEALRARTRRGPTSMDSDVNATGGKNHGPMPGLHRIGLVGRLVPVKRADLFLDVASELARRSPGHYSFDIVGDGPLSGEIRERASAMQAVAVHCHGFVADPSTLVARFSALLITSDHEGLPTVALEALALGVPVISRPIGGLPALARAGGRCVLTPGDDARAIADTVELVVGEGRTSESLLPERYRAATGAARHAVLYRRLLAK